MYWDQSSHTYIPISNDAKTSQNASVKDDKNSENTPQKNENGKNIVVETTVKNTKSAKEVKNCAKNLFFVYSIHFCLIWF